MNQLVACLRVEHRLVACCGMCRQLCSATPRQHGQHMVSGQANSLHESPPCRSLLLKTSLSFVLAFNTRVQQNYDSSRQLERFFFGFVCCNFSWRVCPSQNRNGSFQELSAGTTSLSRRPACRTFEKLRFFKMSLPFLVPA